jgi:hypothetical protein
MKELIEPTVFVGLAAILLPYLLVIAQIRWLGKIVDLLFYDKYSLDS